MTTGIQWTDETWNPITGCDRVSPGCAHCYALDLAARLKRMGSKRYQVDGKPSTSGPGFGVTLHPDKLSQPLRWTRPRRIFVNSMSDLFHPEVPDSFISSVFAVMAATPRHTFQVLTKRPERMRALLTNPKWWDQTFEAAFHHPFGQPPRNVWLGTSVENQYWADIRIPELISTPAAARFLSCEPLLGSVSIEPWLWCDHGSADGTGRDGEWRCMACKSIFRNEPDAPGSPFVHTVDIERHRMLDWIIVGGESGAKHRAVDPAWVAYLRDQCVESGTSFFFKQWGGRTPKAGGRELDGREWSEVPA